MDLFVFGILILTLWMLWVVVQLKTHYCYQACRTAPANSKRQSGQVLVYVVSQDV